MKMKLPAYPAPANLPEIGSGVGIDEVLSRFGFREITLHDDLRNATPAIAAGIDEIGQALALGLGVPNSSIGLSAALRIGKSSDSGYDVTEHALNVQLTGESEPIAYQWGLGFQRYLTKRLGVFSTQRRYLLEYVVTLTNNRLQIANAPTNEARWVNKVTERMYRIHVGAAIKEVLSSAKRSAIDYHWAEIELVPLLTELVMTYRIRSTTPTERRQWRREARERMRQRAMDLIMTALGDEGLPFPDQEQTQRFEEFLRRDFNQEGGALPPSHDWLKTLLQRRPEFWMNITQDLHREFHEPPQFRYTKLYSDALLLASAANRNRRVVKERGWASPQNIIARAFQCWVRDQMAARNVSPQLLDLIAPQSQPHAFSAYNGDMPGNPHPEDGEREALALLFRALIDCVLVRH